MWHQLTRELDLGNRRVLAPSPVLGMYALPTVPTVGAIFKDKALRGQCVVETTRAVYVTEPS